MPLLVDEVAKATAIGRWALPACLHVPIAAVDEDAIRNYIGDTEPLGRPPYRAFVVTVAAPPAIDPLLPICDHANAGILNRGTFVFGSGA